MATDAGGAAGRSGRPGVPGGDAAAPYPALEVQLREVQQRADGLKARMRSSTDLGGLVAFGLPFAALVVVGVLAIVLFVQDETGIGMLFAALTVVVLPVVGLTAWRAFGPMWTLGRDLRALRRREAALYDRLAHEHAPEEPSPGGGGRGEGRGDGGAGRGRAARGAARVGDLPPGNTTTGWRDPPSRNRIRGVRGNRGAALWLLVAIGFFLLLLIVGIAFGASTRN